MEILRDPIWQFIGVILTAFSVLTAFITLPIFNKQASTVNGTLAINTSENSIGFGGFFILFILSFIAAYLSYILLVKVFLAGKHINEEHLLIFNYAITMLITLYITLTGYGKIALLLITHFILASIFTIFILDSLEISIFIYKDFSFLKDYSFIKDHLPFLRDAISTLTNVPIDIQISNLDTARSIFLWSYCLTFIFVFSMYLLRRRKNRLLYLLSLQEQQQKEPKKSNKRTGSQLTNRTKSDLHKRQTRLLDLEIEKKELIIETQKMEVEKKRLEDALEICDKAADILYTGIDPIQKTNFTNNLLAHLLQPGKNDTSEKILLRHLASDLERKEIEPKRSSF